MVDEKLDLITVGRVGIDLYAQNVGAPFAEITGFDASVGGSPTNIAMVVSRLGLKSAVFTAVGEDLVGDFVLRYVRDQGVVTRYIARKANGRTGVAMLAIQPPDRFPLVFYRENPADIYLTLDDVMALPIAQTRALLLSGTALSRGTCRDVILYAAEAGQAHGVTVFMDLDLRPGEWSHPRAFGLNIRAILARVDVVIGTEEEFFAALAPDPAVLAPGQSASEAQRAEVRRLVEALLAAPQGPGAVVLKRGPQGAVVLTKASPAIEAPGFPVQVLNTVGAGDAFASGLLYGYLHGWDWYHNARMGNACGALVVTRNGCSEALPYEQEALDFIESRGGF